MIAQFYTHTHTHTHTQRISDRYLGSLELASLSTVEAVGFH